MNWNCVPVAVTGGASFIPSHLVKCSSKLLNSTDPSPADSQGQPSPRSQLLEFTRALVDNEIWSIPFVWEIRNITQRDQNRSISGLALDNTTFVGELAFVASCLNFRFVFDLRFYDEAANGLAFSWNVAEIQRSAWTQVWFTATITE